MNGWAGQWARTILGYIVAALVASYAASSSTNQRVTVVETLLSEREKVATVERAALQMTLKELRDTVYMLAKEMEAQRIYNEEIRETEKRRESHGDYDVRRGLSRP